MTPTPEQIKAAHEALDRLIADEPQGSWFPGESEANAIRSALPPLPEPERPRITPARELRIVGSHGAYDDAIALAAVRARDAEIISWIGFRIGSTVHTSSCQDCAHCAMLDLVREMDEPDAP